ncbi:MAG: sulfatase-like hydrolase/transferase, partial [Verrucomicrobiota bacterium]
MGNDRVHTPHLDRLASESVFFSHGYVPTSVCRPSLVTLLTGLYPHQHGVHFNHGPPGNAGYNRLTSRLAFEEARQREFALLANHQTLPGILSKTLGYRCLQTGKFWEGHWKNGGFTEGMTTFEPPPPTQTFGGTRILANGERAAHGNGDAGLQIGRSTLKPIFDFITTCESKDTPWMVWYAPYLPHQPHNSPERFVQRARARPDVTEPELPYFASIAELDHTIGQLLAFLEAHSDRSETLIVFVVDNGWSPSNKREKKRPQEFAHTKNSKRAPFDAGLRTPILLSRKGVLQPRKVPTPVSSVDLFPTILHHIMKSPPTSGPGRNILEHPLEPLPIFGAIWPGDASTLHDPSVDLAYRWIRRGPWKLIQPEGQSPWGGYLKAPTLFHIERDPFETTNLWTKHPQVQSALLRELDQWWAPSKDNHLESNPPLSSSFPVDD